MAYTKLNLLLPNLGVDVSKPPEYIDQRSSPDGKNISIERGVLRKRTGSVAVGESMGEEIMAGRELLVDATRYVVRIGLSKVGLLNESTGEWSDVTGSDLTGTTGAPFSTATPLLSGARILVFSQGVDNIRKYTGTGDTADLGGTPPKCSFLQEWGVYLFLAKIVDGGNNYYMRVQWCDTGDIEEWSAGNAGYVDLIEDGNDITGLSIYGNYICVHKESAIYLGYPVSTDDVFLFERKNTGVGTVCNATIQNIGENAQIFLARDGIRIFNGVSAPLAPGGIVPELNEYWVAVPIGSQTGPDTIYKYNYVTGQCYKDYMPGITAAWKYQRTSALSWDDDSGTWDSATDKWDDVTLLSQHQTVMFGSSAGVTTRRDSSVNNDNDVAISAFKDTKDFTSLDFGSDKGRMVRWLEMQIWAKGNNLTLQYSTDSGATWNTVATYALSSDYPSDSSPLIAYFDFISTQARFRFLNETSGETFYLKDFVLGASMREARR
jgi:hypothetical protein